MPCLNHALDVLGENKKPRWTTCKIMSTPVNKLNVISSFRLPNLSTATVSTDVNWTPLSHLVFEHCQFCLCGVHLMNHIPSTFRSGNLSAVFYINWGKTRTPTALSDCLFGTALLRSLSPLSFLLLSSQTMLIV